MSTENKSSSTVVKGKPVTKDYISQIKKGAEATKEQKVQQEEDLGDWEKGSEEEEETGQTIPKKGVVVEQGKLGTDKPKKLKDLFADDSKPKKPKQEGEQ